MKHKLIILVVPIILSFPPLSLIAQQRPAPGEMVDIGGYSLHFNVTGSGDKTIVIETGTGSWSLQWMEFQSELSKHFKVVTYDRAGYGWSDPSPYARTADNIVDELHIGLEKLGITSSPYVILGHSFGGLLAKAYLNKYPDEISAIVLVDAASEYQFDKLPPMVSMILESGKQQFKETGTMVRVGQLSAKMIPIDSTLLKEYWSSYQFSASRACYYDAMFNEMSLLPMTFKRAVVPKVINIPLLVITAGNSFGAFEKVPGMPIDEANKVWFQLQAELLKISTDGRQRTLEGATHDLLLTAANDFIHEVITFVNGL